MSGRSNPARWRCPRSASRICRQCGYRSVLLIRPGYRRTQIDDLADESQLRFGELLAGVRQHQHCIGRSDQSQCSCSMRISVTADTGSVDQNQTVGQQRTGNTHFHTQNLTPFGARRGRGDPHQFLEREGHPNGRRTRIGENQFGDRGLRVLNYRRHGSGLVVTDRAHVDAEQRIDELALALLEGSDHHDANTRVVDSHLSVLESTHQIRAPEILRHDGCSFEQRRRRRRDARLPAAYLTR